MLESTNWHLLPSNNWANLNILASFTYHREEFDGAENGQVVYKHQTGLVGRVECFRVMTQVLEIFLAGMLIAGSVFVDRTRTQRNCRFVELVVDTKMTDS